MLGRVAALDLLDRRRPAVAPLLDRVEQHLQPPRRLRMVARRVQPRQRGVADDLHQPAASASSLPARLPRPHDSASEDASAHRAFGRRGRGEGQRRPSSRFAGRAAIPPSAPRTVRPPARPPASRTGRGSTPPSSGRFPGAGHLVGRVAAQRDEVGHLRGLDAVALANLGRADPRELGDALHRLEDGRPLGDELERVAVGGGDEGQASASPPPARPRRPGSRRPRSPASFAAREARAPATSSGSRSSCSTSASSKTRPLWYEGKASLR